MLPQLQTCPSQLVEDLDQPNLHAEGYRPKPQIVELLNIAEHTHKVSTHCRTYVSRHDNGQQAVPPCMQLAVVTILGILDVDS